MPTTVNPSSNLIMNNLFDPVPLVLYPSEAMLLSEHLAKLGINAEQTRPYAPFSHFVLYDWYRSKFLAWALRTRKRHPKKTYAIPGLPVGIALFLLLELRQNTNKHILLRNVENQLCGLLMNRDLINFDE